MALTSVCGLAWVAAMIGQAQFGESWTWATPIGLLGVVSGASFVVRPAWESMQRRSLDVNVLMLLAAAGAVGLGEFVDAGALMFLFALSGTLENFAMGRTQSAIEALLEARPTHALRLNRGEAERVSIDELRVGDTVRLAAFQQIPIDGVVVSGSTSVDASSLTGEPAPVAKHVGAEIHAGTQNLEGEIDVRVTSPAGESTLDKIVTLVAEAQGNKASGERIAAWFGRPYVWFVLGVSAAAFAIKAALGQSSALYDSLTLLVALSPCALVISTPAATLSAMAWAGRNGALIRGGRFLEELGQIDTLALDKTGTLTEGRPELVHVCVDAEHHRGCWTPERAVSTQARRSLAVASSLEAESAHPIGRAIVDAAKRLRIESIPLTERVVRPGIGVTATHDAQTVRIGRAEADTTPDLAAEGMSLAVLQAGSDAVTFGLQDRVRDSAESTLRRIRALGIERIALLSGDRETAARHVAEGLALDEVHAELLPADKARIVGEMSDSGRKVAMVGDGVNDSAALSRANVGVAMGGLGSDVAINAADVILMGDRIDLLPRLIQLGRRTRRIVLGNMVFAVATMLTLTTAGLLGVLDLQIAVLGHEGSTVLVILNGLRLLAGPGRNPSALDESVAE